MAELNKKSELNLQAAQKLIDERLYAPSVHCSYYAVVQLMKSKLVSYTGISYNDYDVDVRSSSYDSHEYLIEEIKKNISYEKDLHIGQKFGREVGDLKRYRVRSDYKNVGVGPKDGEKAFKVSSTLVKLLKDCF